MIDELHPPWAKGSRSGAALSNQDLTGARMGSAPQSSGRLAAKASAPLTPPNNLHASAHPKRIPRWGSLDAY